MDRNRSGFAKFVVLGALAFVGYTGITFFPAYSHKGQLERAFDSALGDLSFRKADDSIRSKLIRKAASAGVELDSERIEIEREAREGERLLYIHIAHPVTVDYLGASRVIADGFHLTDVTVVDEDQERRRADADATRERETAARRAASAERARMVNAAMAECEEQYGRGNCKKFSMPGTASNDVIKMY